MANKTAAPAIDLGISPAELREQVIERAAEKLRATIDQGDYGHLNRIVEEATQKAVTRYIEKVIVPMLEKDIESITFQATNKWGEKKGSKVTFREYLVERADAWLREEVNHDGKAKGHDSFGWHPYQTRVAHMVHQHLHYSIENAIKDMLKTVNASIVGGIEQTVKMKLAEIQTALKVQTTESKR
jgi:hypothetical protein